MESFGDSLKDGVALSVLVRQLIPEYCGDVPTPEGARPCVCLCECVPL